MAVLFDQINYEKAHRKNRLQAAQWVLNHPETFQELLTYCFANDSIISHKANWALEFVLLKDVSLLFPHLDYFFKSLPSVKEDSSLRPLSHICELLIIQYYKTGNPKLQQAFKAAHKEILIECSFDWLITEQKVACEVRAMTCLYHLGKEFHWIHTELKNILQKNMPIKSAAYHSRGKKILAMLKNSF